MLSNIIQLHHIQIDTCVCIRKSFPLQEALWLSRWSACHGCYWSWGQHRLCMGFSKTPSPSRPCLFSLSLPAHLTRNWYLRAGNVKAMKKRSVIPPHLYHCRYKLAPWQPIPYTAIAFVITFIFNCNSKRSNLTYRNFSLWRSQHKSRQWTAGACIVTT